MLSLMRSNPTAPVRRGSEAGWTAWDPWSDFTSLRRQMDQLFDQFVSPPAALFGEGYRFTPPVDMYETAEEYVFLCHLPGMKLDDINVRATTNGVEISGERKSAVPEGVNVHWLQGGYGQFSLTYSLPVPIQSEQVKATYENGILELHLPKIEAARPKAISVEVKGK